MRSSENPRRHHHVVESRRRADLRLRVGRDITEAKRAESARRGAEAEVRRLNEELEKRVALRTAELTAVNAELEAFCYSVAHDLRSALRHMTSFITLLERRAAATLDSQARRYVRVVSESAERLSGLIDDRLEFSRAGRSELRRLRVDVHDTVKNVLAILGPDAEGRDIVWDIGPLSTVMGDPTMLRSVFTNLIGNALKFTRPRPRKRIAIRSLATPGPDVVMFVRDNGVGCDMRYVERLFGALAAGFEMYLSKPIEPERLGYAIEALLAHALVRSV